MSEVTKLEPWQERVVEERNELQEKIFKLQKIMESENTVFGQFIKEIHKISEVHKKEVSDLYEQYRHMEAYLTVLNRRINRFYF